MATRTLLLCFFTLLCLGCLMNLISAVCQPPALDDPFGVIVVPDLYNYTDWSKIRISCVNGTTSAGPTYSYCTTPNNTWDPDVSSFTCIIPQCLPSNVDDDIDVTNSSTDGYSYGNQPIDNGDTVYLSCRVPGSFIGENRALCNNGTLGDPESQYCAAYCRPPEVDGLFYQPGPEVNVTGVLYYQDGDKITFSCEDGYEEPSCSIQGCSSECKDGNWNLSIPTCQEITTTSPPISTTIDIWTVTSQPSFSEVTEVMTTMADMMTSASATDTSTGPSLDTTTAMPASMATSVMLVTSEDDTETTVSATGTTLHTASTEVPTVRTISFSPITPTSESMSVPTDTMTSPNQSTEMTTSPTAIATTMTTGTTVAEDTTTSSATGTALSIMSTEELADQTQPSSPEILTTGSIPTQSDEMTEMTTGVTSSTAAISTTEIPVTTDIEDPTTPSEATMTAPTKEPTEAPARTTMRKEPTEAPEPCDGTCNDETEICNEATNICECRPGFYLNEDGICSEPTEPCNDECVGEGEACNEETNECDCRQSYYKDEDGECAAAKSIEVNAKVTNVEYIPEYGDPTTDDFKELEEDVCAPINEVYRGNENYVGCSVLRFTEGSVNVEYILTFNEQSEETAGSVESELAEVLTGNGSSNGTLYFDGGVSAQPLDECERELDDCEDTQICVNNGESGFTCKDPDDTWKIIVAVTVSTGGALLIAIVALLCWQRRYRHTTSKEEGFEVNHSLAEPVTEMTANNNGTVGEIILPWREQSIKAKNDYTFGTETGTRAIFPTPDYIEDFGTQVSIPQAKYMASSRNGHASSGAADPLDEIVHTYNNAAYRIDDNDGYF